MDKTKTTDMTENIKENMPDPETSALLQQILREDEKALLEQAQAQHVEENAERKEALRSRILAVIAEEEAAKGDVTGAHEAVKADAAEDIEMMVKDAAGDNAAKKQKRRFSPALRWVAVLALVCAGVFGVSMTSQAKGSGLWSTIQRLIGVETRWEQENNGEDRTYTNPDEFKAVQEIESTLGIKVPEFFYWPGEIVFLSADILEDADSFIMMYQRGEDIIFFEGRKINQDTTAVKDWEGEGDSFSKVYNDITYRVATVVGDNNEKYYNTSWNVNNIEYVLSGKLEMDEIEKILINLKN